MLQGMHTSKEPLSTGFNQQCEEPITFEKFLEFTEIASSLVSLEKRIIARDARQRKNTILNRKMIMPPMLERGLKSYNPEEYEKRTARKLSAHLPAHNKLEKDTNLPKILKKEKMQWGRKWNFLRRRDEINVLPPSTLRYRCQTISQPKLRQPCKKYSEGESGRLYTYQDESYHNRRLKSREHQ